MGLEALTAEEGRWSGAERDRDEEKGVQGKYLVDQSFWTCGGVTLLKGSPFFSVNFSYSTFLCMWAVRWTFKKYNCLVKCEFATSLLFLNHSFYFP